MKIQCYKNLNLCNPTIVDFDFSRTGGKVKKSPLHSISSYLAMFTPALPEYFMEKYSKKGDLICDPFSGRGTTALRAREMKRKFVGSDLNPYAFALTKSKIVQLPDKRSSIELVNLLEKKYLSLKDYYLALAKKNIYKNLRVFYSTSTLSQLIFIREYLGKNYLVNTNIESFVLGIALGLMHGQMKRNGETTYFSISMPNTISMSPNYVKKYSIQNKLKKPNINVFEKIINRIENKYDGILEEDFEYKFTLHDATKEFKDINDDSINLVITSPPYLNAVNYTNSNWLKLWLLGWDKEEIKKIQLSDKFEFEKYCKFFELFLNNIHPKLENNSKVCLVVGDIHSTRLIESVWENIKGKVDYKFIEIFYDNSYSQERKVTNMLNAKKGNATIIEKILVIQKVSKGVKNEW